MSSHQDYANAVSGILEKKGEALAGAKAATGGLWGSTIATLGQTIPKQVQDAMALGAQKRKTAQFQQIIQANGGDLEKAYPQLAGVDATLAGKLLKDHADVQESVAKVQKIRTDAQKAQLDWSDELWGRVNNEDSYARAALASHQLGEQVPDQYDPEWVKQKQAGLLQQKQALEAGKPHFKSMGRGGIFNELTGETTREPQPANPPQPNEASIALQAAGGDPAKAMDLLKPPAVEKGITPYQQAELDMQQKNFGLAQQRLALAMKNANKPAVDKAKSDLADAVMNHPELFGQLTPSEKGSIVGELDKRGFKDFKKPPSATMETRLASAKAIVQTGDDITAQLKDPKVAGMLGPAMGRYNNLREFIGNPPPELSELAGNISSFALAQMGVHGMRNAEMAKQIEEMLNAKHTPESLAARITGINKFANHLLENEGRSTTAPAAKKAPAVGDPVMWQGKRYRIKAITNGQAELEPLP